MSATSIQQKRRKCRPCAHRKWCLYFDSASYTVSGTHVRDRMLTAPVCLGLSCNSQSTQERFVFKQFSDFFIGLVALSPHYPSLLSKSLHMRFGHSQAASISPFAANFSRAAVTSGS